MCGRCYKEDQCTCPDQELPCSRCGFIECECNELFPSEDSFPDCDIWTGDEWAEILDQQTEAFISAFCYEDR
jgi:hypothetical protein